MNTEPLNPIKCDNCGCLCDQSDALPPEFTESGWWCRECADGDMDTFFERMLQKKLGKDSENDTITECGS